MSTTTQTAAPRTLTILIGTLSFVRKTTNPYSDQIVYEMDLDHGNGRGSERVEVCQWARIPTLFGIQSNGCSFDVTLEMVNGKLTEVFPVTPRSAGWMGNAAYQIATERSRIAA